MVSEESSARSTEDRSEGSSTITVPRTATIRSTATTTGMSTNNTHGSENTIRSTATTEGMSTNAQGSENTISSTATTEGMSPNAHGSENTISSTATTEGMSTNTRGSENLPRSTTLSNGPSNTMSAIFKRNVSQKQGGTCGLGDGFPVRSALQCASACLGATDHTCQGYDLIRNTAGRLKCLLNTGSRDAHSECDFVKHM
ncbi:mucin-22-like [Lytechinus pictus]|uniref:mucin-22-like n=1 Tax=Lytechinus pictus TaxID=7653 RepID=UPI0030B9BB03